MPTQLESRPTRGNLPARYGLKVIPNCRACLHRENGLFRQLSPEVLHEFHAIRQAAIYPPGTVVFLQGDLPRGVYILCAGQAKLSAVSKDGRSLLVRRVEACQVLGLGTLLTNDPYALTAETLTPAQVSFIPSQAFLNFLRCHPDVSLQLAEQLSTQLRESWEHLRVVALAPNTLARLAHLLLRWGERHGQESAEGIRVSIPMTQQEIGESIGASRETVNRSLAEFRRRHLIRVKSGSIILLQPEHLRILSMA